MLTAFFIRAKHWQIFLLFMICSFSSQIAGSRYFDAAQDSQSIFGPEALEFSGIVGICTAVCFLWFWSAGVFLNSLVEQRLRPGLGFFPFALIYPALYLIFAMIFLFRADVPSVGLILPLHLLAMYCMIYILYFVSKNLALAETGRRVKFYDFAGPFFLIWFFPLGIWFVQPRLNRLHESTKTAQTASPN